MTRSRWWALLALTALAVGVGGIVARRAMVAAARGPRAAWVWSDSVMRDPVRADSLLRWARRHGVGRIYQHVEPLLLEEPEAVVAFLRVARTRGVIVEALLGDPAWVSAPDSTVRRFEVLLGMHDRLGTDTLAALHLDVEPYARPGWQSAPAREVAAFQALIERLRAVRGTRTLPLHLDLPYWYDEIPASGGGSLLDWLLARVDGVTIMAYVTDTTQLWRVLAGERSAARARRTPFLLGVETTCAPDTATSFCRLGSVALERTMRAIRARYGADSMWHGTAIHAYPDAAALLR